MITTLFLAFAATHLAFLGWSLTFPGVASPRLWILRCILGGMVYDNLALTLGNVGIGSAWYVGATTGRFVLHAALLPLLIPFSLAVLRAAQVPVAGRRDLTAFCWLVALAAWCYGFWHDVGGLQLVAVEVFGHSRLTGVSDLPPFGTIAVNLLLIPLAIILWRRTGWPLLLVGAAFILLVNGAVGAEPWGYVAGNASEVVFILCLLLTERFLIRQRS